MGVQVAEPLQGILVPSLRIGLDTFDAARSSVSPASSRPGRPVADDELATFVPVVEGHQGDDLVVVAIDADRFAYRLGSEAAGAERGWDTPGLMTGFGPLLYSATTNYQLHDCVTLRNGTVLTACTTSGGSTVLFRLFDPATRSVSAMSVSAPALTTTDHLALAMGPDGRVHLAIGDVIWTADEADGYTTWTLRSRLPYRTRSAAPSGPRTMAHGSGGWVMFVWSGTDYEQWSSVDGVRWKVVSAASSFGEQFQVAALPNGQFLVAWIEDTDGDIMSATLGSAWSRLSSATQVEVTTTTTSQLGLAVYADGTAYVYGTVAVNGALTASRTDDLGRTWEAFDEFSVFPGHAQVYLKNLRGAVVDGQVYLQAQHQSGTNANTGLWFVTLGGWSQVTVGPLGDELQRGGYGGSAHKRCYTPLELPDDSGTWGTTVVGTPSVSISSGTLRIAAAAGQIQTYTLATTASTSGDAHWAISTYSGPSTSSSGQGSYVRIHAADGTNDYDVEVRVLTGGYDLFDRNAGASIGSASVDTTAGLEWRLSVNDGAVTVWHRAPGSSTWTAGVVDAAATSDTGTPASTGTLYWGTRTSTTCTWSWLQGCDGSDDRYFTGQAVLGRALPIPGRGVGIPDASTTAGVARLAGTGGAGRRGQSWTIDRAYDYPLDAVFVDQAPSPARRLRTADKSELILVFDLQDGAAVSTILGNAAGMYLDTNGTIPLAYLEHSADGAAWSTWLTYDASDGWADLKYSRTGDIVTPAVGSGDAGPFFLHRRALVGGFVEFTTGGLCRPIVDHSSGVWGDGAATSTLRPNVRVSGITGSESGQRINLVWPRGWVVGHTGSAPTAARFWRLRVPANQDTPYSYYELATLLVGEVVPFGLQTAHGWSEQVAPAFTQRRTRRGSTLRRRTGPTRRTWRMPWDPMEWWIDTDDPDWLGAGVANALPLVARSEVYPGLRAVLEQLDSGAVPLVALRSIPDTDDTMTLNPDQFLYGWLDGGALRFDQVSGDLDTEGQQFGRSADLTVEEAV